MNDPREAKKWSFGADVYRDERDKPGEFEYYRDIACEEAEKAAQIAQKSTRVLCFAMDNKDREHRYDPLYQVGRGFAHSAMWAHYAARHTGVCLIFDKNRLSKAICTSTGSIDTSTLTGWTYEGPVIYKDKSTFPIPFDEDPYAFKSYNGRELKKEVLAHVGQFHQELFFEKSLDWAYEREYRWIFWDEGNDPIYIKFADSLVGVVLGEDFGTSKDGGILGRLGYLDALHYLCRALSIKAFALWWDNGVARLSQLKPLRFRRVRKHKT